MSLLFIQLFVDRSIIYSIYSINSINIPSLFAEAATIPVKQWRSSETRSYCNWYNRYRQSRPLISNIILYSYPYINISRFYLSLGTFEDTRAKIVAEYNKLLKHLEQTQDTNNNNSTPVNIERSNL